MIWSHFERRWRTEWVSVRCTSRNIELSCGPSSLYLSSVVERRANMLGNFSIFYTALIESTNALFVVFFFNSCVFFFMQRDTRCSGKTLPLSLSSANQFLSLLFSETESLESDRPIELISNGFVCGYGYNRYLTHEMWIQTQIQLYEAENDNFDNFRIWYQNIQTIKDSTGCNRWLGWIENFSFLRK